MDGEPDIYMTDADAAAALTRIELATIRAMEAFGRWAHYLHGSVSGARIGFQEICLLHSIRMRGGAQNLSELMMFLNRTDVSTIQYSLRKIEQHGLIERVTGRSRREAGYRLTEAGVRTTDAYARRRTAILLELIEEINGFTGSLGTAAAALERMTGLYDQATQTVLNQKILAR
jgi:predicted MarR family transcription regulator